MNSNSLVSVITIFFNAEQFIQEAIESVFAQTYKNWELLLVDDGSTDGSTVIAREYAKKYPEKVRYLEHEGHQNRGMSATRNLGIRNAKGEYIAFLDADDVWLAPNLEQQVSILHTHPEAGMVYGNTQYWYSWTGNPEDTQKEFCDKVAEVTKKPNTLFKPPTLLTIFLQKSGAVPCTCSLMVKREILEAIAGFEESFRGLYEDQVFYAKVCLKAPVFVTNECWAKYRQHPNSCCSSTHNTKHEYEGRLFFLKWLEKYLTEQGAKDTEVWQALQKHLWAYHHPMLSKLTKPTQHFVEKMTFNFTNLILMNKKQLKEIAQQTLPSPLYHVLRSQFVGEKYSPPTGMVNFGSLRRLTPISRAFGYNRGLPIDRYYIEKFLERQANDVQGRVLEIGDASYTRRFGGDRVTQSDVLHVIEGNPEATIIGDLTNADHIPSDAFDCVVLTQTLHLLYNMQAALANLYRILKPGGVLLVTVPGISQVVKCEWGDDWCWALTAQSARLLFEEKFPKTNVQVETHGNVLAAIAFLQGLAVKDLRQKELDYQDDEYQVLITVRAVKPEVAS
ncbi:glycosyltransferase [Nostoc sp. ATCC 53789]|uniref:glycosyltransferase n=1 Tax=Nostoc sp. ATCC 53789 TaxID=76335 RepID=UPI000DEC3C64|nr:glycosyltransferase [Nostoc sp. ATCC 53789]QHG15289.1 glycosyltransferase [Nostoc sp. ATCC 53789]RCJ16594.1 glycosyl transferase family 2 [Nostoc sp. ATCC 53789]